MGINLNCSNPSSSFQRTRITSYPLYTLEISVSHQGLPRLLTLGCTVRKLRESLSPGPSPPPLTAIGWNPHSSWKRVESHHRDDGEHVQQWEELCHSQGGLQIWLRRLESYEKSQGRWPHKCGLDKWKGFYSSQYRCLRK